MFNNSIVESNVILDNCNNIHFGVIDFLSKNIKYCNLIKKLYNDYVINKKRTIKYQIYNVVPNDILNMIVEYDNNLECRLQFIFLDKIIEKHNKYYKNSLYYNDMIRRFTSQERQDLEIKY